MSRVVLQKLLQPGMAGLVRERGYDQLGGYVVDASAAVALNTPEALRAAYGIADDASPSVDVVRFAMPRCATLSAPSGAERPWPSFPGGFLHPVDESVVPVWTLSTTRYTPGAEVWRVHADTRQEFVAVYHGAARGWSGAREWRPASRYFGTRAVWNGTEYAADVDEDTVELTSFAAPEGDGWTQHRPATWSRTVSLAECEVLELVFTALYQGVPVRVLRVADANVHLQVVGDDPDVASRLGATMIDFGVFEVGGVPGALLTENRLVANQLSPGPQ
ncbi:hypothetical protein AB1K54_15940 [Microbacterium sp. BWT-B31]|uniref:hypothetical protein n=1 Tax=Microbacterium sp. BWT-B31 TaxID=3232072 RepID=UPI00352710C8